MVGISRDLRRSPSPTSLLKQGQLELVAQYIVVRFWIFPQWETPQPLCSTYSSVWPPSQERSAFWCSDGVSSASVCPHCLCPVTGHTQPEPDECSADLHCGVWLHGSLHRRSSQPNEDTSTITTCLSELGFLLHFCLHLSSISSGQFIRKA